MGKIEVYRSAGGNGVRLDASSGFAGAQITVSLSENRDFGGRFVDFTYNSLITIVFSSRFPSAAQHMKLLEGRCSEHW
jgi:hypothetical protein